MKKTLACLVLLLSAFSCKTAHDPVILGSITRIDPEINHLIDAEAIPIVLSAGYEWSEGPVWITSENMLLFSDVPANTIYKWTEKDSVEVFLKPSGYTGDGPSNSEEEGSNGLAIDHLGRLVICQHGDRRLAAMDAALESPQPRFTTLTDNHEGKKFNSPNDVAIRANGDYYFTDPPYGLPRNATQIIPFQGVYRVSDGTTTLLIDTLTRPNGIAFMPEEKTVIIANSDPKKATWYAYDLTPAGSVIQGRVFHDATVAAETELGLPDGLKIDRQGNVFASGPGGVWIFNRDGKLLGKIKLPVPAANCAFSPDEKTLYITADSYLLRLKMRD